MNIKLFAIYFKLNICIWQFKPDPYSKLLSLTESESWREKKQTEDLLQ